ncbi:MmgE/PrpD family protein [Martelella alba]|uniref:MmgE/PrpD family protein n=1 Tax=Martelella alba TaxID=2590451 RepID=A0ABY2SKS4_9HYPH|nr:MmgE/PrpD family protein [Martelella alba]TKI06056.1 MmgE/PrpD family protein [Martelella alba]
MTTSPDASLTPLSVWLSSLTEEALPAEVRHVALRCLVDTVGVMLAGAKTRQGQLAQRHALETGAAGPAQLAAGRVVCGAPAAAFANGVAAHALDFDDNCYAGFVHGSAVIAPAALATAQWLDASGSALITALAVGAECQYRIGLSLGRKLYDRGWWTTGLLGRIGATAAAAWLMGLTEQQFGHALGLAIAGAGGAKSVFGSDAKPLLAGQAAEAGVRSAMLARLGASAPADALSGRYGLAALCNDGRLDGGALAAGGHRWCLLNPGVDIKRIPVCLSSHAAVDAVLYLAERHRFSPAAIRRIECDVPPIVRANLAYDHPATPQQAQFSMPFALAAALCFGDLTLSHLDARVLADPRMRHLMERVVMKSGSYWRDPTLARDAPEGAEVTITLEDGLAYCHRVDQAYGTAAHPLDDTALERKFMQCAGPVIGKQEAGAVLRRLWSAPTLTSLDWLLGVPSRQQE